MGFKFHAEPFISIAVKHAPFNAPHIETPRSYEPLAEGLLKATADSGNSLRLYLTIRYGACVSGFFDADFHVDFSSRFSAISSRSVRIANQLRRLCVGFMSSTFHGERFTHIITPAFQYFPVRRKKSGRRSWRPSRHTPARAMPADLHASNNARRGGFPAGSVPG